MGSPNDLYKTKLMDCAAAIGGGNLILADSLLKEIKSLISAETNQGRKKLVNYYTEALVRRVYGIHPPYPLPFLPSSYFYDFYAYRFAPLDYFAYLTTKNAIKDAFPGKKRVHVINFSVVENPSQRYWLMKDLSTRQPGTGGVSSMRLTSIVPKLSIHFEDFLQEIRQELNKDAEEVQIDFRLIQLVANYKSADDIECCMSKLRRTSQDEMLVVRWCFSLHSLLSQEGVVEKVLLKMKNLKPDIMVIVEQEANHNSPDFLNRLGESFQYYSSVFESLDKHRFTDKKELWERYFGRQICNVVSCEGIHRVERHESLALWQQCLTRAGFLPVRQQLDKLKNDWEKNGFYPGYT